MNDKILILGLNWYNKKFRILAHVSVWILLIALPYIMYSHNVAPYRTFTFLEMEDFVKLDYVGYVFWIAAFYFNSLILVPNYFRRGKFLYYALSLILIYVVFLYIHHKAYTYLSIDLPYNLVRIIWLRLPAFLLAMASSLAYATIINLLDYQEKLREIDQEKLKTELSFLRSQISPHFIFNVLNNIVALVRLNSSELEPTVMKLSGLMKYMLYNTDDEKVSIKVEEEYLNHYIDLQKQRFGKKVKIETLFNVKNQDWLIEPMLLIPFIENAFKHGIVSTIEPNIMIRLTDDKQYLKLEVVNKYNAINKEEKDQSSGIGIINVSRRINLLYQNRHELTIKNENDVFKVNLSLKLEI